VTSELDVPVFGAPPKHPLESVDNALRLLSLFRTHERLRVKDVAEALGVATGTAHRLLAVLQYRGYVTQDPLTRVYVPGTMLLSVGLQAARSSELRAAARPILQALRDELDETVQLATLQGADVFFIDALESSKALRVASRAGTLRPAHCTSVGKALLAELATEDVRQRFPDETLPQATPKSIASRSELLVELETVRARGYAVNFGELEAGIGSVAKVVRGPDERSLAAIGAGAPLTRFEGGRIGEVAEAVGVAVSRLEAELRG